MTELIKEMVLPYSKSVLLFAVGIADFFWFLYLLIKKRYTTPTHRAYLIFSFCVLAWVIGNAYAESGFFTYFGSKSLILTFSFVGSFTTFSLIAFYYLSCLLRYGNKNLPQYIKLFLGFLILQNIFFFSAPNIAIKKADVFSDGSFILLQGEYFFLYYIIIIITILLGVKNIISALLISKRENNPIGNRRLIFIGLGSSIMYGNSIIFHMIYPYITSDYSYSFIPPLFSLLDIIIVGYGIDKRRFVGLHFYSLHLLKKIISLFFCVLFADLFYKGLNIFLPTASSFIFIFLTVLFAIFVYNFINGFLNSHSFYQLFGVSNTEHLHQVISNLKEKNKLYKSVKELEIDLQKAFSTKKRPMTCNIITINKNNRSKYPELIKYFSKHNNILVTEEIKFIEDEKEIPFPFLEELKYLGGVCLPLFSTSKELVGFFTLGKKKYDHLYSKEEIEALENMGSYLSMLINDILYSAELKKEVQNKTIELHNKIQEKNELVKQQGDFIAVTAHEFRTPLSIAMFQLEDLIEQTQNKEPLSKDLSIIKSSLYHLKDLTKKLFEVQQYDLNKVKIKTTKTNMKMFVDSIYKNFLSFMQEKEIRFSLVNNLKKDSFLNVDNPQLKQLMHNLLTNAYKFTPEKGKITLHAQENSKNILIKIIDNGKGVSDNMKKVIFNKFRTDSKGAGLGLGLYLCQKIVDLHRGKIWAEDSPGKGATFCLQLEKK